MEQRRDPMVLPERIWRPAPAGLERGRAALALGLFLVAALLVAIRGGGAPLPGRLALAVALLAAAGWTLGKSLRRLWRRRSWGEP